MEFSDFNSSSRMTNQNESKQRWTTPITSKGKSDIIVRRQTALTASRSVTTKPVAVSHTARSSELYAAG